MIGGGSSRSSILLPVSESTGSTGRNGTALGWRKLGSGDPLIVINGYGGSAADWDPVFIDSLSGFAELICVDNRGIAGSELGEEELTIEVMAADVAAVMDEHGIERGAVLGWSMGGYIAQALAASRPERVSSMALLATDPGGDVAIRGRADDWATLTDHSGSPRERADRLLAILFPEAVAEGLGEDVRELVAQAQAGLSMEALAAQERAMDLWHSEPAEQRLEAISAGVLCAAGRDDRVIPARNSAILAERLPDAWLARFPGAGHAFMAQYPARLAALIRVFLDR